MDSELADNTSTPQIIVGNHQWSLYFNNNPNRRYYLSAEGILLERIYAEFIPYKNTVTGTEITNNFDVIHWF